MATGSLVLAFLRLDWSTYLVGKSVHRRLEGPGVELCDDRHTGLPLSFIALPPVLPQAFSPSLRRSLLPGHLDQSSIRSNWRISPVDPQFSSSADYRDGIGQGYIVDAACAALIVHGATVARAVLIEILVLLRSEGGSDASRHAGNPCPNRCRHCRM
jgi:hypothetical protein